MKKKFRRESSLRIEYDFYDQMEQHGLFVPTAFAVILMMVLFLFREFIFSQKMLYGSDMIQADGELTEPKPPSI